MKPFSVPGGLGEPSPPPAESCFCSIQSSFLLTFHSRRILHQIVFIQLGISNSSTSNPLAFLSITAHMEKLPAKTWSCAQLLGSSTTQRKKCLLRKGAGRKVTKCFLFPIKTPFLHSLPITELRSSY